MDLRTTFPRSPREKLAGMEMLARAIDKAHADLEGTLGDYVYWQCPMNDILFEALGVDAARFLEAVRQARRAASAPAHDFLKDVRESPDNPGFVTDEHIIEIVESPQIDSAVLSWIERAHMPTAQQILEMNARLEEARPNTPEAKRAFEADLAATGTNRDDITTYFDLIDLQEGRLSAQSDSAG